MKTNNPDIIMQNRIFMYIALATLLLLSIPFLFMKFHVSLPDPGDMSSEITWDVADFAVMGVLIFSVGSLFVLVARKFRETSQRIVIAVVLMVVLLWLWAELAVGVFTNWGS